MKTNKQFKQGARFSYELYLAYLCKKVNKPTTIIFINK